MVSKEQQKALRKQAHALKATIQIGKNGLTTDVIAEIKKQLKANNLIKIKFLKGFFDATSMKKKQAFQSILKKTGATLIHKVGFTVILYKK